MNIVFPCISLLKTIYTHGTRMRPLFQLTVAAAKTSMCSLQAGRVFVERTVHIKYIIGMINSVHGGSAGLRYTIQSVSGGEFLSYTATSILNVHMIEHSTKCINVISPREL